MMFSKRALVLAAGILGSSLFVPAAYAGCTEDFVAAASAPNDGGAGPVVQTNIKELDEGVHVYPANADDTALGYANYYANAVNTYAGCI